MFSKIISCLLRTLKTNYKVKKELSLHGLFCICLKCRVGKGCQNTWTVTIWLWGKYFEFRLGNLQNDGVTSFGGIVQFFFFYFSFAKQTFFLLQDRCIFYFGIII